MFVLMWGKVEAQHGSGPTIELEGGEMGRQTEENDEKVVAGRGWNQSAVDKSAV